MLVLSSIIILFSAKMQMSTYAFSAYDINDTKIWQPLVFMKTFVNEDGAYNTATGIYTAPCDGIYEFHATLGVIRNSRNSGVEFKAGEKSIGKFMIGEDYTTASSSGSAIARIQKGTHVFLKVIARAAYSAGFGDDYTRMSSFSGHLISK